MSYQVDWVKATLNIRNHMALQRASKKLGRNKGWLAQVSRGEVKSVEFADGLRLLDLHVELCGREQTAALQVSDADVLSIRQLRSKDVPYSEIAARFGISTPQAHRIATNQNRKVVQCG